MRIAICIEDWTRQQEGQEAERGEHLNEDVDAAIVPGDWEDEATQAIAAEWMEHAIRNAVKEYAAYSGYTTGGEIDWDRDGPTVTLQDSNSDDVVTIYGYIDGEQDEPHGEFPPQAQ